MLGIRPRRLRIRTGTMPSAPLIACASSRPVCDQRHCRGDDRTETAATRPRMLAAGCGSCRIAKIPTEKRPHCQQITTGALRRGIASARATPAATGDCTADRPAAAPPCLAHRDQNSMIDTISRNPAPKNAPFAAAPRTTTIAITANANTPPTTLLADADKRLLRVLLRTRRRRGFAKPSWHGRPAHETRARCRATPAPDSLPPFTKRIVFAPPHRRGQTRRIAPCDVQQHQQVKPALIAAANNAAGMEDEERFSTGEASRQNGPDSTQVRGRATPARSPTTVPTQSGTLHSATKTGITRLRPSARRARSHPTRFELQRQREPTSNIDAAITIKAMPTKSSRKSVVPRAAASPSSQMGRT